MDAGEYQVGLHSAWESSGRSNLYLRSFAFYLRFNCRIQDKWRPYGPREARTTMISPGDLIVFLVAVGITVAYVFVLHHFISKSETEARPPKPETGSTDADSRRRPDPE